MVRLLLSVASCTAAYATENSPPTHDRLTVATYNVQNMLDAFDDPYLLDEELGPKPRAKIQQIARVLRRIDADVIALQEIENEGLLRQVANNFLNDMGYRYVVVQPTNSRYGLNLGLMSRRPVLSIASHRMWDLPLPDQRQSRRFARDLLRVRIQATDHKTLDVFVAHFKSRHDSRRDPRSSRWRLAEATAAHQITKVAMADQPGNVWALLLGDLNAVPGSPTLTCLLQPWPNGQPMWIDVHAGLPDRRRVTYLHRPHRSTIDYIFASPSLAKRVVLRSARVLTEAAMLTGSDHAPVVVTFDTSDLSNRR